MVLCDDATVFYKRFRNVCPQCNTVVHVKRVSLWLWPCLHIEEKESTVYYCWGAMKCRKALLCEEELVRKETKSAKWVRELLKHMSRLCTDKNRTEHIWQVWKLLKHLNRLYMAKNRTEHMASMRTSETFEQTLHRQQQDRVHKASIRATETPSESPIT